MEKETQNIVQKDTTLNLFFKLKTRLRNIKAGPIKTSIKLEIEREALTKYYERVIPEFIELFELSATTIANESEFGKGNTSTDIDITSKQS